ncbi:ABC transporter permease [Mucilaginibacter agri]|uniref:FtsX-like permease family protein n=1 Tax=Mucilaginibacter agri TaxID=2695265 RepID=A0A966DVD5_9SPHI|nr:ABC transporter permease [Mucilaginibacter agri]NCD71347.1 FtsX-like permease family protein [Mucilaginibacter agri]
MLKNYFKIAWRNLIKNKAHSVINILGLSVGMAVTILIGLWIWDELSFNKSFANYNRIVQVMQHQTFNGVVGTQNDMPIPMGITLRQDYKADFKYAVLSSWTGDHILTYRDNKVVQNGNYMQPEAPDLFTLKMVEGTRSGLTDPRSIMLSASAAKAVFGNADPINKVIKFDNAYDLKVSGVYENFAHNSELREVAFITPWDLYVDSEPWIKRASTRWGNNSFQIFAQLNPNADIDKVSAKIKDVKLKNIAAQGDKVGATFHPTMFLQPMSKLHLYSEFKDGVNTGGAIEFVWMFGIIGVFVLLLACINFMNLSTAQSEKRAKEVGIRKTLGSFRLQLISQFFSESILTAIFSFIVSLLLVQLSLNWFNNIADKTLSVPWQNPLFWIGGVVFSIITGLIAGSYPALYLSSFRPVKVLKGTFKVGRLASMPRKVLVVLQFTISVVLIIGTVVVFRQVQFTKNRPVGYNRNGLLRIDMRTPIIHQSFDAVRSDLIRSGVVTEMAESGSPLTGVWSNNSGFEWRGKPAGLQDDFGTIPVSTQFGKTAGWKIVQGRDFSKDFLTDSSAMVINEAAAKFMNFKNPVGEIVSNGKKYTIIGVVSDMVMSSPYDPVKPTLFPMLNQRGVVVNIRVNPNVSMHEALAKIEAVFKQYDPSSPFGYIFSDEDYAKKFSNEERIGNLAGFFTILAIFISCMGLFGMASFMAEQRTKEIGVRKVLGATVLSLWQLMSKDFVVLILISLFIAVPIGYYFMNGWLQDYKYRSDLSWWIFALTGLGTIAITLLTVSYQSIKAALANPVKSLRSE